MQYRSEDQKSFHREMELTSVATIFGTDVDIARVQASMGWPAGSADEARSFLSITTPRRWGKTFSVALYVAALALCFPLNISVFSTGRRASESLLRLVVQFYNTMSRSGISSALGGTRLVKCNNEVFENHHERLGKASRVCSFPSNKKSVFLTSIHFHSHPHS